MSNISEVMKEQIREAIFSKFEHWEIDEELNESRFKEIVKKNIEEKFCIKADIKDIPNEEGKYIIKVEPYIECIESEIRI